MFSVPYKLGLRLTTSAPPPIIARRFGRRRRRARRISRRRRRPGRRRRRRRGPVCARCPAPATAAAARWRCLAVVGRLLRYPRRTPWRSSTARRSVRRRTARPARTRIRRRRRRVRARLGRTRRRGFLQDRERVADLRRQGLRRLEEHEQVRVVQVEQHARELAREFRLRRVDQAVEAFADHVLPDRRREAREAREREGASVVADGPRRQRRRRTGLRRRARAGLKKSNKKA